MVFLFVCACGDGMSVHLDVGRIGSGVTGMNRGWIVEVCAIGCIYIAYAIAISGMRDGVCVLGCLGRDATSMHCAYSLLLSVLRNAVYIFIFAFGQRFTECVMLYLCIWIDFFGI